MVSYEVQPTNNQELSKRHQGAMKLSKGSKIHDITWVQWHVATLKETLPTIGYGNNTECTASFCTRELVEFWPIPAPSKPVTEPGRARSQVRRKKRGMNKMEYSQE
jgi:hypothetical protein